MDSPLAPMVSVLTPAYNAGLYVMEAVQSILVQTYVNWELIILDDGSTDDTARIIRQFADDRISIIVHEKNKGIKISRDELVAAARGEIICWMDADDISYPDRLAIQVNAFAKDQKLVLCSGVSDTLVNTTVTKTKAGSLDDAQLKAALFFGFPFRNGTIAMRRIPVLSVIETGLQIKHAEDYVLYASLLPSGTFYQVGKALIQYREHKGEHRITNNRNNAEIVDGRMIAWRKMLSLLYIETTDHVLQVHDKLSYYQDRISKADAVHFNAFLRLMEQVVISNKKWEVFDKVIFQKQVGRRIFEALSHPMFPALEAAGCYFRFMYLLRFKQLIKLPPKVVFNKIRHRASTVRIRYRFER